MSFHPPLSILALAAGAAALSIPIWRVVARRALAAPRHALHGAIAQVVVAIPASGVGSIACRMRGRRIVLPARDDEGGAIAMGRAVIVVSLERGTARVTPFVLTGPEGPPEVP
ncbi:hypothetical protein [Sandaracinus amylolyticus]|uniref:hypothetical protein n=1 Tax=Sandaracinus amylolyticus TaxID=927083 RepID=UPI001F165103|nr:hypothetical protein [Sandaracinus amylolyticus]UJR83118.1 Hypothetical protein I5071_51840 [Sandaracinus amylolyticus]